MASTLELLQPFPLASGFRPQLLDVAPGRERTGRKGEKVAMPAACGPQRFDLGRQGCSQGLDRLRHVGSLATRPEGKPGLPIRYGAVDIGCILHTPWQPLPGLPMRLAPREGELVPDSPLGLRDRGQID